MFLQNFTSYFDISVLTRFQNTISRRWIIGLQRLGYRWKGTDEHYPISVNSSQYCWYKSTNDDFSHFFWKFPTLKNIISGKRIFLDIWDMPFDASESRLQTLSFWQDSLEPILRENYLTEKCHHPIFTKIVQNRRVYNFETSHNNQLKACLKTFPTSV